MLVEWLTFIALVIYAYFTYLIAKDTQEPFVSFVLIQLKFSHINFRLTNRSKVEVEVLSKLWLKINGEIFQFKKGFYADDTNWILQPFTEGGGHFDLKNLKNSKGLSLEEFVKKNKIDSINFNLQITYRKVGSKKWKKSSPQNYVFRFDDGRFWLNV
jgi:hypothetical protein